MVKLPSTLITVPVRYDECSELKNSIIEANSSGDANLPSGIDLELFETSSSYGISSFIDFSFKRLVKRSVKTPPGHTVFIVTPLGAISIDNAFENAERPARAVDDSIIEGVGSLASVDDILIILPHFRLSI